MSISIYSIPDHPANEARRAAVLDRLNVPGIADDGVLNALVLEACHALRASMAAVTLVHGYDVHLIAAYGFAPGVYRRSTSLCGHAILAQDRFFVVHDTLLDRRFAENPFVAVEGGIRFYAAAQLIVGADVAIGTLCVFDHAPRAGTTDHDQRALLQRADRVLERLHHLAGEEPPSPA